MGNRIFLNKNLYIIVAKNHNITMEEKQILINYLSQNEFSKHCAKLYVNNLSKNPQESTDLKFSSILNIIKFTLNLKKG